MKENVEFLSLKKKKEREGIKSRPYNVLFFLSFPGNQVNDTK